MSTLRSAGVVSLSTLVSRVLGLVRDVLSAKLAGALGAMDAFVVAFTVPNLLRRLLGEGALSAAFVPVFAEEMERGGRERALRFFNVTLTALVLVLIFLIVVGLATTFLIPTTAFGESEAKAALTLELVRIMLPYMLLICVMALIMGVLNSLRHFFAPAIAPALLNVCWIAGLLVGAPLYGEASPELLRCLAVSVVAGGILQLAVQIPALRAQGVRVAPCLDLRNPAFRRMLRLMLPVVIGLAPVQINIALDRLIAEIFVPGDGANSHLFYGIRLMQFPLAIVGIAMGVAVFPGLSRLAASGRRSDLADELGRALRTTLFLGLPATVGLAVLAVPLIELIYDYGQFVGATEETSRVLFFYALGVFATCGLQVVTRAFYALQDTKTPVKVTVATVALNLALNLVLVFPLREAGLALSTSITAVVNLAALVWIARRKLGVLALRPVARSGAGALVASLACGAVAFVALTFLRSTHPDQDVASRLVRVAVPVVTGGLAFFAAAALLRLRELHAFVALVKRR